MINIDWKNAQQFLGPNAQEAMQAFLQQKFAEQKKKKKNDTNGNRAQTKYRKDDDLFDKYFNSQFISIPTTPFTFNVENSTNYNDLTSSPFFNSTKKETPVSITLNVFVFDHIYAGVELINIKCYEM